jgi:hypothetical protein
MAGTEVSTAWAAITARAAIDLRRAGNAGIRIIESRAIHNPGMTNISVFMVNGQDDGQK